MQLQNGFLPIDVFYFGINLLAIGACLGFFAKKWLTPNDLAFFYGTWVLKLIATGLIAYLFAYHFPYVTDVELLYFESIKIQTLLLDYPDRFLWIYYHNLVPELYNHHFFSFDLPRAFFLIKVLSLVNFVTNANYWLNSLWFSVFSFCCGWYLCRTIRLYFPTAFKASVLGLLAVPTTVAWTSGLLKESFAFGLLCLLCACFLRFTWGKKRVLTIVLAIVSSHLLFMVKFYVLGAFLLVTIPLWFVVRLALQATTTRIVFFLSIFCATLFFFNLICTKYFSVGIAELMYYNHKMMGDTGNVQFYFEGLSANVQSYTPYLFPAIGYGLFMPLPLHLSSPFLWPEALVNLVTCCGCMVVLLQIKQWEDQKPSILVYAILFYVVLCSISLAISAPNYGTLARYKVVYFPFLHLLLFYYFQKHKWFARFRRFHLF